QRRRTQAPAPASGKCAIWTGRSSRALLANVAGQVTAGRYQEQQAEPEDTDADPGEGDGRCAKGDEQVGDDGGPKRMTRALEEAISCGNRARAEARRNAGVGHMRDDRGVDQAVSQADDGNAADGECSREGKLQGTAGDKRGTASTDGEEARCRQHRTP